MKEVILALTSIPGEKIIAYKNLTHELSGKVDPSKFKNEMALIDLNNHPTLYGAEGVSYIFSSQYKPIDILLRRKLLFQVFKFIYRLQAYNRYIIATPKSNFQCDCFPDKMVSFRLSYIALTIGISVLLTVLFGISLKDFFYGMDLRTAGLQMLLMAGTGWILQIGAAWLLLKDKALDYIGHLGSIMVAGLLVIVPWMLFKWLTGIDLSYFPAGSVVVSSFTMLQMHIHRVKYLALSQAWTLSWFLFLQLGAVGWIYFFHFKF